MLANIPEGNDAVGASSDLHRALDLDQQVEDEELQDLLREIEISESKENGNTASSNNEDVPEEALCRICKLPQDEGNPLFHPCKVGLLLVIGS